MIMDDKPGAQTFHHGMSEGEHDPPNKRKNIQSFSATHSTDLG